MNEEVNLVKMIHFGIRSFGYISHYLFAMAVTAITVIKITAAKEFELI